MTRKDYILLAKTLNWEHENHKRNHLDLRTVEYIAEGIAVALEGDNPRFNREHFLAVVAGERDLYSRPPR